MSIYGSIDLCPVALCFAGMVTDPAAYGRKGARLFDYFKSFPVLPPCRKAHIRLYVIAGRAPNLAGGGLLFFLARDPGSRIATSTFIFVVNHDTRLFIDGNGPFGTGGYTGGIIALLTDIDPPREIEFAVNVFRTVPPDREVPDRIRIFWAVRTVLKGIMFLFARHFACSAPPARFFIEHNGNFIHWRPPLCLRDISCRAPSSDSRHQTSGPALPVHRSEGH